MKIGVAISVYNKGHFVATNMHIFDELWVDKPYVSVCCNDFGTFKKLKGLNLDSLVLGRDLPYATKPQLRLRQHDCIRTSILAAAPHCDYIIHWHADAFALDQNEVEKLIGHMEKNHCHFAARGLWKSYRDVKIPDGDLDDHFFIIKSDQALLVFGEGREAPYNNYVESLSAAGLCSEGILSNVVQRVIPQDRIHIYSDMGECEVLPSNRVDRRYSDGIAHRTLPPVNFDKERKFLHCDDLQELVKIFKEQNINTDYIVGEL